MKKFTFPKLLAYLRNKYYGFGFNAKVVQEAKKKLVDSSSFLDGFLHPTNPGKRYTLSFTSGLTLTCRENDLSAIAETCLIDDYNKVLKGASKKGLIIFDIGAHIGSFSVSSALEGARVYSFEPNPDNYALLLENIKRNNLEGKVIPTQCAIMEQTGKRHMNVSDVNYGGHTLTMETHEGKTITVETKTLAEAMKHHNVSHIDLIKMDIEGAEYPIFKNIPKETLDAIERIVGEYHLSLDEPKNNYFTLKRELSRSFPKVMRYDPYYFYATRS
jgi:FkbM family methyltransferase